MGARWPQGRDLIPYAILLAALLLTAGVARYAAVSSAREDLLRFQNTADSAQAAIANRLDAYVALLRGAGGLFSTQPQVTLEEFRAYIARLELTRYPGVQGMGFSRRVPADRRSRILQSMRDQWQMDFRFWPERPGETHAILYLEPQDVLNQQAIGFDMTSEAVRRSAMERARDTGALAVTGRVPLAHEAVAKEDQVEFLIYVPVYFSLRSPATVGDRRELLRGFVFASFRTGDLFESLQHAFPEVVNLEIHEADSGLLYRTSLEPASRVPDWLQARRRIDVAGQSWLVTFRPGPHFTRGPRSALPMFIAAGGVVLSALLFLLVRSQVRARSVAERVAAMAKRSEEALRAVDREKDAFLATISHELRTPLNAIVGWASMLGRGTMPAETQAHAITVIERNAAAQTRLIEDLLDMSRAVTGHLSLEVTDVDIRATLDAAVDALRPAREAAGVTLQLEGDARLGLIEADAVRLQQIVMNLLSNSIKFTPRGGRITLGAARSGGMLIVTVTDTGSGIHPEFVPFLFERFKQADSSPTRAHSGVGLGLAIVRHLVHLHGGTIEAASGGLNAGATFTVRLPISRKRKTA
jgi:signal transduction histidine kinase